MFVVSNIADHPKILDLFLETFVLDLFFGNFTDWIYFIMTEVLAKSQKKF